MAKFYGNLHLVLATGLILAIIVIMSFTGWTGEGAKNVVDDVMGCICFSAFCGSGCCIISILFRSRRCRKSRRNCKKA